ncbi:MAG: 2'-5' RNA ligase family protein [Chloroflexota bacterium]
MTEPLRAFIAIELPRSVLDYIQSIQDALRKARFSSIAWARPQGIHLTLKFLGNILPDQVPPVIDAM